MNDRRPIIAVVTAIANGVEQKRLINGAVAAAMSLGYDTAVISNVYNSMYDNKELLAEENIYELARSEDIDGIIIVPESFATSRLRSLAAETISKTNVPVVITGADLVEFSQLGGVVLNTDDFMDMEIVAEHMIAEHGYSDIAILTGQKGNPVAERRVEGFKSALAKHGIEPDDSKIIYGDFWFSSGEKLAKEYVAGERPIPRALVAANDYMAYGFLSEAAKGGLKVPERIAVVSYEYPERRMLYTPLLTSFNRNREELGRQAVLYIDAILNGKEPPALRRPVGYFVKGESCGCSRDVEEYCRELEYAATQRTYSDWNLFSTMDQRLTACRGLDEFVEIIGENQWLIRQNSDVYLCLYNNWYEADAKPIELMSCRSILPWEDNTPFDVNKYDFRKIFSRSPSPAVYYFTPLFAEDRRFGRMIVKYDKPDGYDDVYRNWQKSVANGLEFLRMKNDIQYLSSCHDLSEYRDALTGMYNEKGVRRAYANASLHGDKAFFFVYLRIRLFDEEAFSVSATGRIEGVQAAAAAVTQFCGNHDISAHPTENVFVCIIQSKGDAELLSSSLASILIQHKKYLDRYGMDSFVCEAEACEGRSYDELFEICRLRADEKTEIMAEKRSQLHYAEVVELRNTVYSAPEFTFDSEGMFDSYVGNPNHLRMLYKKCFGVSFHQDCIAARVSKARYYLATTSLSMADVAEKCGYLDNKYFLRQFSSAAGITAGQYRNLLKG